MKELIERIEGAEEGSRELDCAIGVAIERFYTQPNKGWPDRLDYCERRADGMEVFPGNGFDQLVPRYSSSLDAAMSLVPEGMEWGARCAKLPDGAWAGIGRVVQSDGIGCNTAAATPALALCAAALRAIGDTHDD